MSFEQQLITWRRELHQYPELSLQEVATTARIRDWLESGGLRVLPYELKTGLVVEVGSGDKIIALRADIDALPIAEATGLPSLIPPLATGQRACTPCACWRRLTTARRC